MVLKVLGTHFNVKELFRGKFGGLVSVTNNKPLNCHRKARLINNNIEEVPDLMQNPSWMRIEFDRMIFVRIC
jgi:hypothetical protein